MYKIILRYGLPTVVVATLAACGNSGSGDTASACVETGAYACQTGDTEPLYTFQWALNYAGSYFNDFPETFSGGLDLNVEPVHRQGFKGQGVNVLVLDSGTDLQNEDLQANADPSMSWNFVTQTSDPYPTDGEAHGTVVSGIIAAAQNGKGVMGIAPLATLGGANYLSGQSYFSEAYGGAAWSENAHIFNASYGGDTLPHAYESPEVDYSGSYPRTLVYRGLKNMRDGKGAIFLKAAGNSFDPGLCGLAPGYYDCSNPANDTHTLEPNIITVAALNSMGGASSYSSAGPVVWVTGMGGEFGNEGVYGEGKSAAPREEGPTIFGTDLSGCIAGYSNTQAATPFLRGQSERNGVPDNSNCDYAYMNGTSAATPTITGVAALALSANPALTWRDMRDILRKSARKVDEHYPNSMPGLGDKRYGSLYDLTQNQVIDQMGSAADIQDGATTYPMNLGWQTNAAGHEYSDWYGFGVPDAAKVVALALEYKNNPSLSRSSDVLMPDFRPVSYWHLNDPPDADDDIDGVNLREDLSFPYQRITSLGEFAWEDQIIDQLQVRLTGNQVCLGSIGIAAKSPSGTVSLLKLPEDNFKAGLRENYGPWNEFAGYALGSYTFYGESAQGNWELFLIASNPDTQIVVRERVGNTVRYRLSEPCPSRNADGSEKDFSFFVEARIIAQ